MQQTELAGHRRDESDHGLGKKLDMLLDPPKVIELEVDESARRWRLRRIVVHSAFEEAGRGAFIEPISWLLRS